MTRGHLDMLHAAMLRGFFRKGPLRYPRACATVRTPLFGASGLHHEVFLTPELGCPAQWGQGAPTGFGACEDKVCQGVAPFLGAARSSRRLTSPLRTSRSAA